MVTELTAEPDGTAARCYFCAACLSNGNCALFFFNVPGADNESVETKVASRALFFLFAFFNVALQAFMT